MLEAALRAQGGVTAFAQNTRDEVRIQGDGTLSGALAAQPGMKQQTYVAEPTNCLTPWDVQSKRVFAERSCAPTLQSGTHEHNQHVAEPLVLASAHYNAEIGEGGGPHSDCPHPEGCACTSNGEDVFPPLCATDGSKQFIDNQSVNSGRLLLDARREWP